MKTLADYVEIIENNMECVILKVKPDSRMALIALGCFNGNEEMIRLTKGETQTCTLFYKDGGISSWSWGAGGIPLYLTAPLNAERWSSTVWRRISTSAWLEAGRTSR